MQTAYANGASGKYLTQSPRNLKLDFAKTGVKFVHHVATHYDIGVYFEANGHGTVLVSPKTVAKIRARLVALQEERQEQEAALSSNGNGDGNGAPSAEGSLAVSRRAELACRRLLAFAQLVNQAVRLWIITVVGRC